MPSWQRERLRGHQIELVRRRANQRIAGNHEALRVAGHGVPWHTDFERRPHRLEQLHELDGSVRMAKDLVDIPRVRAGSRIAGRKTDDDARHQSNAPLAL